MHVYPLALQFSPMRFPMFGLCCPAQGQYRFMFCENESIELPVFVALSRKRLLLFHRFDKRQGGYGKELSLLVRVLWHVFLYGPLA